MILKKYAFNLAPLFVLFVGCIRISMAVQMFYVALSLAVLSLRFFVLDSPPSEFPNKFAQLTSYLFLFYLLSVFVMTRFLEDQRLRRDPSAHPLAFPFTRSYLRQAFGKRKR